MSKLYKEIYKLDSVGNIRTLMMEQSGGAYRTHTGILGGKIVTTDWTLAKAKNMGRANETSPEEQAEAEIEAQYTKKLKTGYTLDIDDVETALEYVAPMLAKNYKDYKNKIDFSRENWGVQTKYNGCVSGDTLIQTKEFGPKPIKYIIDNQLECSVLSFENGRKKYRKVTNFFIDKSEDVSTEWYEVELESGEKMTITGNHPVFLPELNCWRNVENLEINDILLTS